MSDGSALRLERVHPGYEHNDGGAVALAETAQQFLSFEGSNGVKQILFLSLFTYTASWEEEPEFVGIFNQISREPNGRFQSAREANQYCKASILTAGHLRL